MNEMDFNPDAPLHIRSVSHLTIPVKDRYKAARFYVVVLGAEVHHESAPDNVKMGRSRSLQVGVEAERSTSTTPDGNNLELNCPNYPGAEKLHWALMIRGYDL